MSSGAPRAARPRAAWPSRRARRRPWPAAAPPIWVDFEPYVPVPRGTMSVSPLITVIFSTGIPICSDAICANVVSWPWPCENEPVRTIASPVGGDLDRAELALADPVGDLDVGQTRSRAGVGRRSRAARPARRAARRSRRSRARGRARRRSRRCRSWRRRGRVRERVVGDEVPPADLGGIESTARPRTGRSRARAPASPRDGPAPRTGAGRGGVGDDRP